MLTKRIIPCLDVKDGRVVKGVNFVELEDAGDPVALAKRYNDEGADELVFLDITASVEKRDTMAEVVKGVAKKVFIPLTVGGGIRSIKDIQKILKAGADKVSLNTAVAKNPKLIKEAAKKFGSQCIVIAIDAKREKGSWQVYINGGRTPTGLDAIKWAKKCETLGAGELLVTSMDKDGTKSGYDNKLMARLSDLKIPVIASGGAGSIEDMARAFTDGKANAVLAASVFHYGKYSVNEIKTSLKKQGMEVRE